VLCGVVVPGSGGMPPKLFRAISNSTLLQN
jgi:hypothetical protein